MGHNLFNYFFLMILHCFEHYEIDMLYWYTLQNVPTKSGVRRIYPLLGHTNELDYITICRKWWFAVRFVKHINY